MKPARQRIGAEVERWFLVEPLLFAAWTTHRLAADPRVRTLRIHHGTIAFAPAFIDALSDRQLRSLLVAEAMRILLKHPYSRRKSDAERAWLASNITLAEYVKDPELPFPRAAEVFGTAEFDQKYYEFYYQRLVEEGGGPAARGTGDGLADHARDGENAGDWEPDELLTDAIDDRIRTAAESDRWGTLAGRLKGRILATLVPKLDYRAVLRSFRASVLSTRLVLTRMRPSRRYGFAYLGKRRQLATRLLVAIDVSGSMSNADLAVGFSIVNRFFKYGIEAIDVLQFDTEIQGDPLPLRRARREVSIRGRGGTAFAPVLGYIDEHRDYDGLIVFTDGVAPVPPRPRNRHTRVLWLFTSEANWARQHAALRPIGASAFVKGS